MRNLILNFKLVHDTTLLWKNQFGFLHSRLVTVVSVVFVVMLITLCSTKTTWAQNSDVEAAVLVDDSNKEVPLTFQLKSNKRTDIAAIRITMLSGKFSALQAENEKIRLMPLSDRSLELRMGTPDDERLFETGSNMLLMHALVDSSEYNPKFHFEFFNLNGQSLAEQTIFIEISQKLTLPGPCPQTFLSFATAINQATGLVYPSGSIDPNWMITAITGTSLIVPPAPVYVGSWGSTSLSCKPSNPAAEPMGTYTYTRTFCAALNSTGNININVTAYDSCSVWFNGILIGSSNRFAVTTASMPMDRTFAVNVPVNIINGTNKLDVKLYHIGSPHPNIFSVTGGINSTVPSNLALTSDNCCSAKGTISGHKYWDLNCNGKRNGGEPGVSGWVITLFTPSGGTLTTTTNASGYYSFNNLPFGNYTVVEGTQSGWLNSSTTSFSITPLGVGQTVTRDFLNCKKPDCSELFNHGESSEECCQYDFNLSNALGPISKIEYTVTGGTVTFVDADPCLPTSTTPSNLFGSTNGNLMFVPACNNTMDIKFGAQSNTATGLICVKFTFYYQLGVSTFSCDTTVCFQCVRAPEVCGQPLNVVPHIWDPTNTDWRTFTLTNVKLPISTISSVDIQFINEPTPLHHYGGDLFAKTGTSSTNRGWTVPNSGGSDPYTQIRMNCSGTANPHGLAATDWVMFNLGVDKTLNYSGVVHLKIGFCDGDTCELDYVWQPIVNGGSGKIASLKSPENTRIFSLEISPIENTASYSITLQDTSAKIIATTAPSPSLNLDKGNLYGLSVSSFGNNVLFSPQRFFAVPRMRIDRVMVVFTPGINSSSDLIPVNIRYFDIDGNEIGSARQEVIVSKVGTDVDDVPVNGIKSGNVFINSVVPNPATSTLTITYTLAKSENAKLEIYNSLGQTVSIISEDFQTQGVHQSIFNVEKLTDGSYYIQLTTKSGTATALVNVIH